jgi:hypothetical protein
MEDLAKYDFDKELEQGQAGGQTKFHKLAINTVELLKHLKDGSLKSFRSAAASILLSDRADP